MGSCFVKERKPLYSLTVMEIYPRLGSMGISTRKPRVTITVVLGRMRILIRCQGLGVGRPIANPRQLILTSLASLTRMTRIPRLSRSTRLHRHTRLTRMTSITSLTRHHILTRLEVMDTRTRLTRMISLASRRIIIRG